MGRDEIDDSSPMPLFHQVELALIARVRREGLRPGLTLPSETTLATDFGVSRLTVRRAIERLVQQGVLVRRRGVGTFVADLDAAAEIGSAGRHLLFVLPNMNSIGLHLRILGAAQEEAEAHGYQLVVAHARWDPQVEARHVLSASANGIAGILLWPLGSPTDRDSLAEAERQGTPLVLIDRFFDGMVSDHVVVDDVGGAYAATSHLIGLGHRRIALFLFEDLDVSSVRLRAEGYRRAHADHGLLVDDRLVLQIPERTGEAIRRSMMSLAAELLAIPDRPTAVFCINDHLAQELVVALGRYGLSVPADISVAGFDGLDYLATAHQLTTARRAIEEMGREGIRLLLERIHGDRAAPARQVVLPTELVIGTTTAVPSRQLVPDRSTA